jgi:hypothetical protein
LKDIRNSNPKDFEVESESYWLDPDVEAFSEIRNAMEHRSLKIFSRSSFDFVFKSPAFFACFILG